MWSGSTTYLIVKTRLFHFNHKTQNTKNKKLKKQFDGLGAVFQTIDADILRIVEAPNPTFKIFS